MKAIVCEMCGSHDLVKQDGMYICQYCGTKYSTEEAKKLMVEVSGSVKIDNSDSIENYFKIAENAYASSNQKEAENYCNKIIEIDPDNYKAWLLKGKAAGWQSTLANIRIEESVNCFTKAVDNAPEDDKDRVKSEASGEIEKLSSALMSLCCNNFAKFASKDNVSSILDNYKLTQLYSLVLLAKCGVSADGVKKDIATKINNAAMAAWNNNICSDYVGSDGHPTKYQWTRYIEQGDYVLLLLNLAIDICDDDDKADIIRYQNMIAVQTKLINSCSYRYSGELSSWVKDYTLNEATITSRTDKIMGWHQKIKEIDPNYEIPARPKPQKGGCYVATAVYGSYDCPQVWTLRRYRDYTLAETWYGRAFIHTYYAVSPVLVKWFGGMNWFTNLFKPILDKMVSRLNNDGVSDTPYNDRGW